MNVQEFIVVLLLAVAGVLAGVAGFVPAARSTLLCFAAAAGLFALAAAAWH